jgi:hypothetical protein
VPIALAFAAAAIIQGAARQVENRAFWVRAILQDASLLRIFVVGALLYRETLAVSDPVPTTESPTR